MGSVTEVHAHLLADMPEYFLREALDDDDCLMAVLTTDGYNPGSRADRSRVRVSVSLVAKNGFCRPLTLFDQLKGRYACWRIWVLPDALRMAQLPVERAGRVFRVKYSRVGGDHAELWIMFTHMGGNGHRSAFCATEKHLWLHNIHRCERLFCQELDAVGFT